jgi:predicted dehydrogenase
MAGKKLKTVIIGTGVIAETHAVAVKSKSSLNLTACWNRIEERDKGEAFASRHGIRYYASLDEMLETERPDITVNCLAYKYHCLGLEKAAMLGSHLMVEKPMGISVAACKSIIDVASKYNVKLAVSESSAFNGVNLTYRSLRGRFGKTIHMIDTNYRSYFSSSRNRWAFDPVEGFGGMILNVGVHRVSRLRMFAGDEEYSVCAHTGKMNMQVEGDACILIRYKNNACGIIMMCGYHNPGKNLPNFCRIVTEKGHISPGEDIRFVHSDGHEEIFPVNKEFVGSEYSNLYSSFAESIITNTSSPYPGEAGMRDVAVILAAFKSFQEKKEVTIDEIINT